MNVQLTIDLSRALRLSLNVGAAASVPGIYANLTTTCALFEPGEFANGVSNDLGPNVFILHDSGAAQGPSQRFAYIGVTSQVPFTLQQLRINVYTNARGSSPANPVIVAVEASPRDDFAGYTTLGTVQSHQNPQTLASSLYIPAGMTYVRFRSLSAIQDNSNYLAYSDISLAGSSISGAVVEAPEPVDPDSGQGVATGESVTVSYDFTRAANGALLVAAAGSAQKELVTVLSTNALPYEPGQFPNGVTSFGPSNVFSIHNSGSAHGANQRYIYVVIATQLPLVVGAVTANFTSNASGSSPANPVVVAIEASPTPDFQDLTTLGSVSTVSPTCSTAALLPRGVSYIRLRATTPIPDGSNYIAFSAVTISCARVLDTWPATIGSASRQILTCGNLLLSVSSEDGTIWEYSGKQDSWARVGDAASQFVCCEAGAYALTADKSRVIAWDQFTGHWDTIGGPMESLLTGRNVLHGVTADGYVWLYLQPGNWTNTGGPFRDVVATDEYCIGISWDGQSVQMQSRGSSAWTVIGGPMASLRAAGNAVYSLDTNGLVYRYSGSPNVWTPLGGPFGQLVISGNRLLGITTDGLAVMRLVSDSPLHWTLVGQQLESVCTCLRWMAGLRNGAVLLDFGDGSDTTGLRTGTVLDFSSTDDDPTRALHDIAAVDDPVPPTDSQRNWIFRFHTSGASFTGYDGDVNVGLAASDGSREIQVLQDVHFSHDDTTVLGFSYLSNTLDHITLAGSDHFWPDHWTVDKIQAWNIPAGAMYEFSVSADVPNPGDQDPYIAVSPSLYTPFATQPTYARVLIWPFIDIKKAAGHASIVLSDGTYISWWPSGQSAKSLAFADESFSALVDNNRTYADDFATEGQSPTTVLPVYGLDEGAIKKWWAGFNVPGSGWRMLTQNCSTTVYQVILYGGGIPDRLKDACAAIQPWAPWRIEELAQILTVKNYAAWDHLGM